MSENRRAEEKKKGRPRGDPSGLRERTLGVRVSEAEYAKICEKAATLNMRPTEWLREAGLSRQIPKPPAPKINVQEYNRLAHLSANLNQLTRMANYYGRSLDVLDRGMLMDLLKELIEEVKKLRSALIGEARDDREDNQGCQL